MPERERPKIPNPQFLSGTADGGIAITWKGGQKSAQKKRPPDRRREVFWRLAASAVKAAQGIFALGGGLVVVGVVGRSVGGCGVGVGGDLLDDGHAGI